MRTSSTQTLSRPGGDMAEVVRPPFAAPSEAASERDVLLATKLNVPGRARGWCRARGWRTA